jgi:hypothetical protein
LKALWQFMNLQNSAGSWQLLHCKDVLSSV